MTHTPVKASTWVSHLTHQVNEGHHTVFLVSGNTEDLNHCPEEGEDRYHPFRIALAMGFSRAKFNTVWWDKALGFDFGEEMIAEKTDLRNRVSALIQPPPAAGQSPGFAQRMASDASQQTVPLPRDVDGAFRVFNLIIAHKDFRNVVIIIDYAEAIVPAGDVQSLIAVSLQTWARFDSPLRNRGIAVVLVERNAERCAEILRNESRNVGRVHIPLPDAHEMLRFIYSQTRHNSAMTVAMCERQVALARGLRCMDYFALWREAMHGHGDGKTCVLPDEWLLQRKKRLIQEGSGGLLRLQDARHGFDVIGGLDYLLAALRRQTNALMDNHPDADKGWLLMGPPGTGKTLIAEALAKEVGFPLLVLGNIMNERVGNSERNMRFALDMIANLAPCIVFIDEAAELIGSGDEYAGDSGVANRLRGMLQNFMGNDELRGRVFFILATNYPEKLPPAMLREGRIDRRIPFLPPDDAAREHIFRLVLQRHRIKADALDTASMITATRGWTGAELEQLALTAKRFAGDGSTIGQRHLDRALVAFRPLADRRLYAQMAQVALEFTNDWTLAPQDVRPPEVQRMLDEGAATPPDPEITQTH